MLKVAGTFFTFCVTSEICRYCLQRKEGRKLGRGTQVMPQGVNEALFLLHGAILELLDLHLSGTLQNRNSRG